MNPVPQEALGAALLTCTQLAPYLSVSPRMIWSMDAAGKLPAPVRLGRSVRWRKDEIDNWLKAGCPSRQEWLRISA